MLIKLMKYDLGSTFKHLSAFYAIGIVFAVLTRIFLAIDGSVLADILGKICSGVTIAMIFNAIINNVIGMWRRFRKNLYGDEAYLTHTLPVKRSMHYAAKLCTSVITLLASMAVSALLLFVAYYSKANMETLKALLFPVAQAYEFSVMGIITAALVVVFLEILNALQCGFMGIILGHMMRSVKIGFSILFGFVVYMLTSTVVISVIALIGIFSPDVMNLLVTNNVITVDAVKALLYIAIGAYSALAVLFCIINMKLFGKGVNIE